MSILLRFDGASKGNPGLGGSAAVLYKDNEIVDICYYYHPKKVTNNVAEYFGLLGGLNMCLSHGYTNIMVEGDSKLVIEQVFGTWNCKDKKMISLCAKAKEIKKRFISIFGKWIPREKNIDADYYSNQAILEKSLKGHLNWFIIDQPQIPKQKTILEAFNNAGRT